MSFLCTRLASLSITLKSRKFVARVHLDPLDLPEPLQQFLALPHNEDSHSSSSPPDAPGLPDRGTEITERLFGGLTTLSFWIVDLARQDSRP